MIGQTLLCVCWRHRRWLLCARNRFRQFQTCGGENLATALKLKGPWKDVIRHPDHLQQFCVAQEIECSRKSYEVLCKAVLRTAGGVIWSLAAVMRKRIPSNRTVFGKFSDMFVL